MYQILQAKELTTNIFMMVVEMCIRDSINNEYFV